MLNSRATRTAVVPAATDDGRISRRELDESIVARFGRVAAERRANPRSPVTAATWTYEELDRRTDQIAARDR